MSTTAAAAAASPSPAGGPSSAAGGGARVSVPASARQTIRAIREIAGDHADEEVYAMLRECEMDPNETAQRLLLQDTFHEVKRRRDRRREVPGPNIPNNREPVWRPGSQGRGGGRGGRGNYPSRYVSQGVTGVKIASTGKLNGVNQVIDKNTTSTSVAVMLQTEKNSTTIKSSSAAGLANGPRNVEQQISQRECAIQDPPISCTASVEDSRALTNRMEMPSSRDIKSSVSRQNVPTSEPILSTVRRSVQGVDASIPNQLLGTSQVTRKPASVAIKNGVWSQRPAREAALDKVVLGGKSGSESSSLGGKSLSETCRSGAHENKPSNCQECDVNQLPDASQSVSSSHLSSSIGSRPSSSYSNRSQQQCGPLRATGPNKEWKPKSTDISPAQPLETLRSCDAEGEGVAQSQLALSSTSSEDSLKLQKKLFNLQFPEAEHVIIPDHLQVPESERMGLSFGSLDALFGSDARLVNDSDSENNSSHLSESSQGFVENVEGTCLSNQNASPAAQEAEYIKPHTPELMTDNLSSREPDLSSTSPVPEYDQSKFEEAAAPGCLQLPVAHSAPIYSNFGIVPPMLGSHFSTLECAEQQPRDASRLTGFVQPFDPSPYYTQIYRPAADGAFIPANAASKYNGNIAAQPAQTGQSPQEGGNSSLLSSSGPTPVVQTAGVLQSSLAINQQPVPVFRQPTGVHLSHFPPNFFPYSQYLSPFYVPPPTFPHFLSSSHYPQQLPAGSLYPPPAVAAGAAPVKYPISHKSPSNSGNPNPLPSAYGSHSSSLAAYNPVTNGFTTGNDDLTSSQYKESNVYVTGQQHTEGSAVWLPGTGRDISALQPGSFYNVSQGQHMSFAPTQAGHGAFTGMYHPSQTVTGGAVHVLSQAVPGTVEMVAPPTGVYPQQGVHINWNNSY